MPSTLDEVLTAGECAIWLRMELSLFESMVQTGEIKPIHVSNREMRFHPRSVLLDLNVPETALFGDSSRTRQGKPDRMCPPVHCESQILGDKLLTIEELAECLQMSVETVRQHVREKSIPVISFNQRLWRFHWPTVLAALQKL